MTRAARAAGARLAVAGPALAGLALLAGGCGTPAGSSAASVSSAAAASPASSAPSGAAAPASSILPPSPATTLTAPPAYGTTNGGYPCPASFVRVTLGASQATPSVTYQVIEFTNRGSRVCSLGGYAGVSLAGGKPLAQIGLAATPPPDGSARAVTLNPGQSANSVLQISSASNYPKATCDPVHAPYLVVAVPNTIGFVTFAYGTTACANSIEILSVSRIVLGSGSGT
jgi:hypothetical protein